MVNIKKDKKLSNSRFEGTLLTKFSVFYDVLNKIKIYPVQVKLDKFLDSFIYGETDTKSIEFIEFISEIDKNIKDIISQVHDLEVSLADLKGSIGVNIVTGVVDKDGKD